MGLSKLERFLLFATTQGFKIIREYKIKHGYIVSVSDSHNNVHCTFYQNGNIFIQGKDSRLKEQLLIWAGKKPSAIKGGGWAGWYMSWREWDENAGWLEKYIQKNGMPQEDVASDEYKAVRELLFHDYMFRQKSTKTVSFRTISFVIKNWINRFCFMNLDVKLILEDVLETVKEYETDESSIPLCLVADSISEVMSYYCGEKLVLINNKLVCPQTKEEEFGCNLNIIDAIYPYSSAGEVIAYTKSNFEKLIRQKKSVSTRSLSWYGLRPKSPIESKMAEGLKNAGILNIPQYQAHDDLHKYKIDFVIKTETGPLIAIECDGLQYHAHPITFQRDKIRDRYLQQRGFYVMRFASVEIFNKLDTCIREIDEAFWRIQKRKLTLRDKPRTNYFGMV